MIWAPGDPRGALGGECGLALCRGGAAAPAGPGAEARRARGARRPAVALMPENQYLRVGVPHLAFVLLLRHFFTNVKKKLLRDEPQDFAKILGGSS